MALMPGSVSRLSVFWMRQMGFVADYDDSDHDRRQKMRAFHDDFEPISLAKP